MSCCNRYSNKAVATEKYKATFLVTSWVQDDKQKEWAAPGCFFCDQNMDVYVCMYIYMYIPVNICIYIGVGVYYSNNSL